MLYLQSGLPFSYRAPQSQPMLQLNQGVTIKGAPASSLETCVAYYY